ncbi:MAG: xanthine dehydrogenase family protein molybdopterin-binding subunit [Gammaproteobacteria bacterium]|nr:xanthine dehydrogenase family protein molybdopterin-binding subunit [Gammaproteobacteria bacterium]
MKRRHFLKVGATATGGFYLTASIGSVFALDTARETGTRGGQFNAYLEIDKDGRIFITCPQAEMGQGIHDGLPKILAEELEAQWEDVVIRLAGGEDTYVNPITRRHRTASSDSTMTYFALMRTTGATAREMLRAAAAERWGVSLNECRAERSKILHERSGHSFSYGELAADAARQSVPSSAELKDQTRFSLVGTTTPRKDTPSKVDGSAIFGIDVTLPGMLHAVLRRSTTVKSRVIEFDRDAVLTFPGVVDAFEVSDGVAIVAKSTWHARRAADTITVKFDESESLAINTAGLRQRLRNALNQDDLALIARPGRGQPFPDLDATLKALSVAHRRFEWEYEVPYVAHAALEPLCATVVVHADEVEAWIPTQQPDRVRDVMSELTGVARSRCLLNVTFLGGGFGRKWELDFVRQAVQIANAVSKRRPNTPVKLTWTREQDFRHDRFRPAHMVRTRIGIDESNNILVVQSRITGGSILRQINRPPPPGVADFFAVGDLISNRYLIPLKFADFVEVYEPVPIGMWRSVSSSMNGFFSESALDDVAYLVRRDPLQLRLELCEDDPRAVAVLRKAAQLSDWERPLGKGRGRGISLTVAYGSYCAEIVEVAVKGRGVTITRVITVFDCGLIIDPRNVEAQVQGGIIWGLSAAIDGQVRFEKGAAIESNFDNAPILRFAQTPPIEVHLLRSGYPPGGAGEASVPGVAPALASAIQIACGERPRSLPIVSSGFTFT